MLSEGESTVFQGRKQCFPPAAARTYYEQGMFLSKNKNDFCGYNHRML